MDFDNKNPVTQNYLINECREYANAIEHNIEFSLPRHFYTTLVGFEIMATPPQEEVLAAFYHFKNQNLSDDIATIKGKELVLCRFLQDNF